MRSSAVSSVERNPWLDCCRALAITLLLLGHGRLFLIPEFPYLEVLRGASFVGVELFFVLSGFLIGGILLESAQAPHTGWLSNFYARRWWRTLPNFYLFASINVGLALTGVRPSDMSVIWQYPLFMQSLLWPHPVFFAEAWSLAIEEVFYFLFPLSFVVVGWLFGIDRTKALLVVAVAVLIVSPVARMVSAVPDSSWDEEVRKVTLLRLDSIMVGVVLAWAWRYKSPVLKLWRLKLPLLLALIISTACVAVSRPEVLNESFFAKTLLFTLAPFGCAFLVSFGLDMNIPRCLSAPAAFLARISYSAYLANIPIAILIFVLWPSKAATAAVHVEMFLAFISLSVVVSWILYHGFEKKFLQLRDYLSPPVNLQR